LLALAIFTHRSMHHRHRDPCFDGYRDGYDGYSYEIPYHALPHAAKQMLTPLNQGYGSWQFTFILHPLDIPSRIGYIEMLYLGQVLGVWNGEGWINPVQAQYLNFFDKGWEP
jgi:hypothetical protein